MNDIYCVFCGSNLDGKLCDCSGAKRKRGASVDELRAVLQEIVDASTPIPGSVKGRRLLSEAVSKARELLKK